MKKKKIKKLRELVAEIEALSLFLVNSLTLITKEKHYNCEDYVCLRIKSNARKAQELLP